MFAPFFQGVYTYVYTPMPQPRHTQRVMLTLPKTLLHDLQRYARSFRGGNKSGFVADAIQAYISHLEKARHTRKMRDSYAAAATDTLASVKEWEDITKETWPT